MTTYLWGRTGNQWHALARHDPEYAFEERVSERLTALARRQDSEAAEVKVRVHAGSKPGTGITHCGQRNVLLDEIGVDPDQDDRLCPACTEVIRAAP